MTERWRPDHVEAMAPDAAAARAARQLAVPRRWHGTGADDEGVWGECRGSGSEAYQVVVELATPAFRCSCPSRKLPCKHTVALLLLWAHGHVPTTGRPPFATTWLAARAQKATAAAARQGDPVDAAVAGEAPRTAAHDRPVRDPERSERTTIERSRRTAAGLAELDRWITDRVRTGLTDPALAQYTTWEQVAARLVDAQAPALANRIRRLAGAVGTTASWHEHVLAELGVVHALCRAGARTGELPEALGDGVRTAVGWQVRQADVLAGAAVRDRWHVAGRSDVLEDRIVVRRTWLRGTRTRRWVLLLSFAAYGQSLGGEPVPGTAFTADVHQYPGAVALRGLLGPDQGDPHDDPVGPPASSVAGVCHEVGLALAQEPWLERHPCTVLAAPTLHQGRWVLTDATGTLPVAGAPDGLPTLVACSGGRPVAVSCEWTAQGLVPLTVHGAPEAVDVGPRGGWS